MKDELFSRYRDYIDTVLGAHSVAYETSPRRPELGIVMTIAYRDFPKSGYVTAFTYGNSLVRHSSQSGNNCELMITIRSENLEWVEAISSMVDSVRGLSSFAPGKVIAYYRSLVSGTDMTALLLARPSGEWSDRLVDIDLGVNDLNDVALVDVLNVYPVHSSEISYINKNGIDAFMHLGWDPFDPRRPPAV